MVQSSHLLWIIIKEMDKTIKMEEGTQAQQVDNKEASQEVQLKEPNKILRIKVSIKIKI